MQLCSSGWSNVLDTLAFTLVEQAFTSLSLLRWINDYLNKVSPCSHSDVSVFNLSVLVGVTDLWLDADCNCDSLEKLSHSSLRFFATIHLTSITEGR